MIWLFSPNIVDMGPRSVARSLALCFSGAAHECAFVFILDLLFVGFSIVSELYGLCHTGSKPSSDIASHDAKTLFTFNMMAARLGRKMPAIIMELVRCRGTITVILNSRDSSF